MTDHRESAAEARLRMLARERHQADAEFRRAVRWTAFCIAVACICTALAVWSLQ